MCHYTFGTVIIRVIKMSHLNLLVKILGRRNVHFGDFDEMSVGELSLGEMSIGEMSVSEMSVGEMSWIRFNRSNLCFNI